MNAMIALQQVGFALGYYVALVLVVRLAGKRLAGQVTTFDLLVLITLGVVLQGVALLPGRANAAIFVVTVFGMHRGLAALCGRYAGLRHLVRGRPQPLIHDGRVDERVMRAEGMSREELMAGLRKLGILDPSTVAIAVLEETGHVSAVEMDHAAKPAKDPSLEAAQLP